MPISEEWSRQIKVKEWVQIALPLDAVWSAIDQHVGKDSVRLGGIRKARGIKKGVPDWYFFWRGITVWAEQKKPRGRLDSEQSAWLEVAAKNGARTGVFVETAELAALLTEAGIPLRVPAPEPTRLEKLIAEFKARPKPKATSSKPRQPRATQRAIRAAIAAQRPR